MKPMHPTPRLTRNPDGSWTVTGVSLDEAASMRLRLEAWDERRKREVELLRADLSCVPFYAKKAKAWEARTGDEMGYWLDLYGSSTSTRRPPEASSTVAKA